MGFHSLSLYQYRNLRDATVSVDAPEVFLIGENGQGKTNLLEAIYLLCFGSSFRTRKEQLIITHNQKEMSVQGTYAVEEGDENRIHLALTGEGKRIQVNGKRITDRKQLISNIPCIVFSHDDIRFIFGPPDRKRWFFNQTMSLFDPLFIDSLRKYQRILKLRNAALKNGNVKILEMYNLQLAAAGLVIQGQREELIGEFNETFSELSARISNFGGQSVIRYQPSWKGKKEPKKVITFLEERKERDLIFGTTTTGPHRDRFTFTIDGRDFGPVASTGQLRLMSLILKVAQAVFFSRKTRRKPLLLLDDVLLELDQKKRRNFLQELPEYEQAFFTFLPDEPYDRYRKHDTMVYTVENGEFMR
jgi:DNA replication and repair protein RecF